MTRKTGYETGPKLKWMKPILEQWIKHNRQYQKHNHPDDSLFFYGERPSVGTLAAAAWSVPSGYAVQEYYAEKKRSPGGEKTKSGREDLYLGLREKNGKKRTLRLEAKYNEINAHSKLHNGTFNEAIKQLINSARDDTRRNVADSDRCVALAIAHFFSHKDRMNSALINRTAEAVVKIQSWEARAWFFTDPGVNDGDNYDYFGTALFINPRRH